MPEPCSRVTFRQCVAESYSAREFVKNFDRLTGSNLGLKGTPLDLMIDNATGRMSGDFAKFVAFVFEIVWIRLPPDVRMPLRDDPDGEFLAATLGLLRDVERRATKKG